MKNFKIGKEINRILSGNVLGGVGNKVYPLVATNAGVTFPFIVYRRIGYKPQSNKDYTGEIVTIEINVASESYESAVTIADSVADILNNAKTSLIEKCKLTNVSEMYLSNTFIQNLVFEIELT